MAETFLNDFGRDLCIAESAGLEPGTLNPYVVKVMSEIGYDISENKTKSVFDLFKKEKNYDYVITVCDPEAAERCPVFPGLVTRLHWGFKDPSSFSGTESEILAFTREVRDEILSQIKVFLRTLR
jgi:arsenate reductase